MPQWIAHVQLHDSKSDRDYEVLHTSMARMGFWRKATDSSHAEWKLPAATYFKSDISYISREEIADSIKTAAKTTRCPFWFFVAEYENETASVYSGPYDGTTYGYTGADPTLGLQ